jgi:hypothetical protein
MPCARWLHRPLGVAPSSIATWYVFKRSFDARKKLLVVYILDVTLTDASQEAALLTQHAQTPHPAHASHDVATPSPRTG